MYKIYSELKNDDNVEYLKNIPNFQNNYYKSIYDSVNIEQLFQN